MPQPATQALLDLLERNTELWTLLNSPTQQALFHDWVALRRVANNDPTYLAQCYRIQPTVTLQPGESLRGTTTDAQIQRFYDWAEALPIILAMAELGRIQEEWEDIQGVLEALVQDGDDYQLDDVFEN